jgi:hypothetical protein
LSACLTPLRQAPRLKVLTLHSRRVPNWALPWVGGLLFTALVAVAGTSAAWYLATIGVPH